MSTSKNLPNRRSTLFGLLKPALPKPPRDANYLFPLPPKIFTPPRGQKEIYLPNFTLTLLRPHPDAPPHFASFLTPLNLNKLDLKDYLYNVYGVHVLSVRSYVQQQKVREGKPSARWPQRNQWYRPRATKKMTVELARDGPGQGPFVWPEELKEEENLSDEERAAFDQAAKDQKAEQEARGPDRQMKFRPDVEILARQARELKSGKEAWKPGWVDYGVASGTRSDDEK